MPEWAVFMLKENLPGALKGVTAVEDQAVKVGPGGRHAAYSTCLFRAGSHLLIS